MILVIDTGSVGLSSCEFAEPVASIVGDACVAKHYSKVSEDDLLSADKVIICGNPLADDVVYEDLELFKWIQGFGKPVLGICAGMQIIALVHGVRLCDISEIGMKTINIVNDDALFSGCSSCISAYCLHKKSVSGPSLSSHDSVFEVIARSDCCVECIKVNRKDIYGVLFHPEVRNREIIVNFLGL